MPIYEYVCQSCGRRVEVMHGVHEAGPADCDSCGGAMRKALSTPAIVFKGSGWAKVDARARAAARPAAEKSDGSDGKAADKGSAANEKGSPAAEKGATPPASGSSETGSSTVAGD